ncbi:MAG: DUF4391 domain-containing protein [Pyrinomonadaceae bacterium]|nr:DUF4391 domain-containing protein [Pyrinomonadaceae bacterium]
MSLGLFAYPKKAEFGRALPKGKIYEKTRVSAALRKKFVQQIDRIVWQYKLSTETVNLPAKKNVPEIEIFSITLREPEIHSDILKSIDNAIPFPIIYELVYNEKIKIRAAYKRPSDADSSKWITDIYFESVWQDINTKRKQLPVALDLGFLYGQMLSSLMPASRFEGESIRRQVQRLAEIRNLEARAAKIELQMRRENQFNRKVELNSKLRELRDKIGTLSGSPAGLPAV